MFKGLPRIAESFTDLRVPQDKGALFKGGGGGSSGKGQFSLGTGNPRRNEGRILHPIQFHHHICIELATLFPTLATRDLSHSKEMEPVN